MISIDNSNRLIGDFFEANSSIAYEESTNTKSPKWLVKYRAKKQRKKLLSIIEKLTKSSYILTRDNLYELFVYLFNNADIYKRDDIKVFKPDDGEVNDRIEGVIIEKDIKCLIHIDHLNDYLEIVIENNGSKKSINRKELSDNSGIAGNELKAINQKILDIIYDFLKVNIERYIGE